MRSDLVFPRGSEASGEGGGEAGGSVADSTAAAAQGEGVASADGGAGGMEEAEEETCFVCLDGARDAILLECGHGGLCVQVTSRVKISTKKVRKY